jgi:hypothetical protein
MLSADREWLTRRASGEQFDSRVYAIPWERTNVPLMYIPTSQQWVAAPLILANGVTRPFVPFNDRQVIKAGNFTAHRETAGTGKQLY